MSYRVKLTPRARGDIKRLQDFLAEKDRTSARRSLETLRSAFEALKLFPYSCRKVDDDDPTLRELLIPFGRGGYAAIFRIRDGDVRILAIRHQLEDDYL